MIPPVGAGVWIEFEAGDPSRADLERRLVGRRRGPDRTSSPPSRCRARKILRTDQDLLVSLDDDAQTISVSDGNGTNI